MEDLATARISTGQIAQRIIHKSVSEDTEEEHSFKLVKEIINDETKDIIIDYKTTKSVAPDRFATSVRDYSYHIQAAHYIYVWERATKRKVEDFIFIAVEKERPHLCNVFRLDEDTLEEGRVAHKKAMYKFKNCAETDIWGGYEQVVHTLSLPRWAFKHTKPKQHGIT